MKLPGKLALVSLGLLLLPWAGCQYIADMEALLKQTQAKSVAATARAASGVLAQQLPNPPASDRLQYGFRAPDPMVIDGYNDDWSSVLDWASQLEETTPKNGLPPLRMRWLLGVSGRAESAEEVWYLWIEVSDPAVIYPQPAVQGRAYDRLRMSWVLPQTMQAVPAACVRSQEDGQVPTGGGSSTSCPEGGVEAQSTPSAREEIEVATVAPGWVTARRFNAKAGAWQTDERIQGHWQDTGSGFTVELRIRAALPETFALAYENVFSGTDEPAFPLDSGLSDPAPLVHIDDAVDQLLSQMAQPGIRLWAVNPSGWVYGRGGVLFTDADEPPAGTVWFYWFYRQLLGQPDTADYRRLRFMPRLTGDEIEEIRSGRSHHDWYRLQGERVVLSAAEPIRSNGKIIGAVVAEQADSPIALLTDQAVSGLLGLSLILLLGSGGLLFGYASFLSWRIRRLSRAAKEAMQPDGQIIAAFPVSKSADELGDLSRSFALLLQDLHSYTDYLKTLASKLSHELKTPLAVVRSSLEHLNHSGLDEQSQSYAQRAEDGAHRLTGILNALSEATRLEQLVEQDQPESFDWQVLLRSAIAGYEDARPEQRFELVLSDEPCTSTGMPELLLQLLDKLVDNACDFAVGGTAILIRFQHDADKQTLSVENQGPLLPEAMQEYLFDSLVSLREAKTDAPHLGLGLHVARLIAEANHGRLMAENLADGSGVIFTLVLPR